MTLITSEKNATLYQG